MENREPGSPKRPCSTCCEPIAAVAKKCIYCESYQDWRRHLSMSSSILALLVALVSVAGLAAPALKTLVISENSDVEVKLPRLHQEKLYLLAMNRGIRPGIVSSFAYRISLSGKKTWGRRLEFPPAIVQPNSAIQIVAPMKPSDRQAINDILWEYLASDRRNDFRVDLLIEVEQFNGTDDMTVVPVPIYDVLDYNKTKWNLCFIQKFLADETNSMSVKSELPSQNEALKACGVPTLINTDDDGDPAGKLTVKK
jgi:hypothetical protein